MANDDVIILNPGVGGAVTDASDVATDPTTGRPIQRERVVLGGDAAREQILDLLKRNGRWRLPTYDEFVRSALEAQYLLLDRILVTLGAQEPSLRKLVSLISETIVQEAPTFAASTNGAVATGTASGTVQSIGLLFQPASGTKKARIEQIDISWVGNGGNNFLTFNGARTTSDGTGGTVQPVGSFDTSNSSALVFRSGATGAPTRIAGDLFTVVALGGSTAQEQVPIYRRTPGAQPIILEPGQGFEVRSVINSVANIASNVQVAASYIWTEV